MTVTAKGHVIGDRVGTEMMSFIVDEELYSAYYSKIQVDGTMMTVHDKSYKTEAIHAFTRKEARRLAIEARDRIRAKALPKAPESTASPSAAGAESYLRARKGTWNNWIKRS